MAGFQCPFCMHDVAISEATYREEIAEAFGPYFNDSDIDGVGVKIKFYGCSNCKKTSIKLESYYGIEDMYINVYPLSDARRYPEYVPEAIRADYEEACAIVDLSPKASATLSRRCIQGMIRDFWGIKRSRLIDEIDALDECIPATQKQALHTLRKIGNIGAHPDILINEMIDVEPSDAKKLIALIEFFIRGWYIERYVQDQLINGIINLI